MITSVGAVVEPSTFVVTASLSTRPFSSDLLRNRTLASSAPANVSIYLFSNPLLLLHPNKICDETCRKQMEPEYAHPALRRNVGKATKGPPASGKAVRLAFPAKSFQPETVSRSRATQKTWQTCENIRIYHGWNSAPRSHKGKLCLQTFRRFLMLFCTLDF